MKKQSFVMTGYVNRGTCNCGCISNSTFWQDGGVGGSYHLSKLHNGIEKYLDELSGAGPGGQGKSCDVKVTVTIEELGDHNHRLMNRNSFSGLGFRDNDKLRQGILTVEEPENVIELKGEEEYGSRKEFKKRVSDLERTLPTDYLQDMYDRMLLAQRTNNWSELNEVMDSLKTSIAKQY